MKTNNLPARNTTTEQKCTVCFKWVTEKYVGRLTVNLLCCATLCDNFPVEICQELHIIEEVKERAQFSSDWHGNDSTKQEKCTSTALVRRATFEISKQQELLKQGKKRGSS